MKTIKLKNNATTTNQPTNQMKFTFTISPANQAAFTRTSDDRTFKGALRTAKMFLESFPGARIEINSRKF